MLGINSITCNIVKIIKFIFSNKRTGSITRQQQRLHPLQPLCVAAVPRRSEKKFPTPSSLGGLGFCTLDPVLWSGRTSTWDGKSHAARRRQEISSLSVEWRPLLAFCWHGTGAMNTSRSVRRFFGVFTFFFGLGRLARGITVGHQKESLTKRTVQAIRGKCETDETCCSDEEVHGAVATSSQVASHSK